MKLRDLLQEVDIVSVDGDLDVEVTGIAYDSRLVMPGDLFVCVSGFSVDGHDYAEDAVRRGAVAVVAQSAECRVQGVSVVLVEDSRLALSRVSARFYGFPFRKFKLIGVTGTNGKTTVTYLIKSILEQYGQKVGLIGTNQNLIGDTVIPTKHTTPESLELMRLFSDMAEAGADVVVMEVSSHSLALNRVAACEFDAGAFTNITQDHLDFHKTMEEYLAAKARLFEMCGVGVINADDGSCGELKARASAKILTYGIENECDIKAEDIAQSAEGVSFTARYGGVSADVRLSIPGRFSVYNALCAVGVLAALGYDFAEACGALAGAGGVKGRAEVVPTGRDFTVIIDYAHTPDGLENIISTVRGFAKGRVITVFGCGGDRDRGKRPLMGNVAGRLSDFCVITNDNPRSENPNDIIDDILAGTKKTDCLYAVIVKRREAIEFALNMARKDDIVLLAGKGHETYQILADGVIDFDERAIVKEILGE